VAASLLALAGCGAGSVALAPGAAITPSPSDDPPPEFWDRQNALDDIADRVEAYGLTDEQYNEVSVDAATNTITVHRTNPTAADVRVRYRALVPDDVRFELTAARFTRSQVENWSTYVSSQSSWLARHGLTLAAWGPNGYDEPFRVIYRECRAPSQEAMDRLQIYGPDTVTFEQGGVGSESPEPPCIGPSGSRD
jgi:hypothetical protein